METQPHARGCVLLVAMEVQQCLPQTQTKHKERDTCVVLPGSWSGCCHTTDGLYQSAIEAPPRPVSRVAWVDLKSYP